MSYQAWLYLQDGSSKGISLAPIGSNLLNNSIDKIITYKSFLKLIPNPAQDIASKSKLKMVAEWTISGEYYQLYGWISGQSSKINAHNFELDDYPNQDFFGDLILFKIDLNGHKCLNITEIDVQTIDIANREDDVEDDLAEEDENDENEENDEYGSDDEKPKGKDTPGDDDDEEEDEEDEDNYNYEDDKAEGDDALDEGDGDGDDSEYYDEDDEGVREVSKKKTAASKATVCNFTRLVCDGILVEQPDKNNLPINEKQNKIVAIFQKLLFPKKTINNINKTETLILREIERGIYNWTIKEADKSGFMCLWDDRQFVRIYTRKAISIYQNLKSDNKELITFVMDTTTNNTVGNIQGLNAYKISFMSPSELCPEKYTEILNKLKEKEKVIFEKRATAGSKQYKCNKCGERDVSITSAQTRSGDEGSTLFFSCNNCGKQWKMS
jgi:DNA-directed RNA polymerase subunit M/transcription elongation factor TFIIS